jgi:transcriptional regulator with XRE-family HTH domain
MHWTKKIGQLIDDRGISIATLADRIGMPRQTLYDKLNGKTEGCDLRDAFEIARFFNVRLEWLADETVGLPPTPAYPGTAIADSTIVGIVCECFWRGAMTFPSPLADELRARLQSVLGLPAESFQEG